MSTVLTGITVIGSLAVFTIGFKQITDSLIAYFGPWLKKLIGGSENSRLAGFYNGFLTSVLSLSNATGVVLLISMANVGLVGLAKTPWLLLGINLGGTITGWIVALGGYQISLTALALTFLAASLPFKISSVLSEYNHGDILTGLGLLLLGIDLLNGALPLIPHDPVTLYYLRLIGSSHWGFFTAFTFGVFLGAMIRSSIGVLVLAMSLSFRGWLPFDLSAAIVLGSNLGLTIIGFFDSRKMGFPARRTALIHLMINAFACIWVFATFPFLFKFINWIIPGEGFIAADIPLRLAMFHSMVHIVNSILTFTLLVLLMKKAAGLSEKIFSSIIQENPVFSLQLMPRNFPDSLDSNLLITRSGLARMVDRVYEMLMIVMNSSQEPEIIQDVLNRCSSLREEIKSLGSEISLELIKTVRQPSTLIQAEQIQQQQIIAQELSDAAGSCWKIMIVLQRSIVKQYRFHSESRDELFDLSARVLDFIRYNSDYLEGRISTPDLELAKKMEDLIDEVRSRLKKRSRKFLEKNKNADPRGEFAFIQIVGYLEHIGDNCLKISRSAASLKNRQFKDT